MILSDILMDNMNGLVLRDKLNTHESWNAIPFLYLTALGDPENTVTGLDKGAIDYISKPFDIEQLKAKVASIINQQKNKENKTIKGRTLHESQGLDQLYKEKNLKERQIKIIELISEGLQNKEIAPIVFLSESSIKKCISEIYQIMGVQNRAELMNLLMRHL